MNLDDILSGFLFCMLGIFLAWGLVFGQDYEDQIRCDRGAIEFCKK